MNTFSFLGEKWKFLLSETGLVKLFEETAHRYLVSYERIDEDILTLNLIFTESGGIGAGAIAGISVGKHYVSLHSMGLIWN